MKKYIIRPGQKGIVTLHPDEMVSRGLRPYEVRERVHAASLNYRDLITIKRGVTQELIPCPTGPERLKRWRPSPSRVKNPAG